MWDVIFAAEFLNCVFLGRCTNDRDNAYIANLNKQIVYILWLHYRELPGESYVVLDVIILRFVCMAYI